MRIERMRKHAEQMHEHLRPDLAATEIEAAAGGGMVTVAMNGLKQVLAITIDPEIIPQGRRRVFAGPCRTSSSPPSTTGNAGLTSHQREDGRADKQTACQPTSCNMALDARPAAPSTATCSRATSGRC